MNFAIPPMTWALLIANLLVFLLQQFAGDILIALFALWPLSTDPAFGVSFMPWQLVTYSFLHGGLGHLFFNMFALFMFGSELEHYFGPRRYLTYYFVSVVAAGIMQLLVTLAPDSIPYPTVGASGGVFGLLLAYGLFFPSRTIMLIFPPIPLPAWLFVTLYGILELYLGVTGTQAGVAHFAHLGGMLGGYLLIRYWRAQARRRW
ncbi:MAG: rhomboid family intramembrane serine protease [Pseudomonadota bacterium]|nr:MAG: DUF1751 domain-containing protein [Pseudomonadota bacterium]